MHEILNKVDQQLEGKSQVRHWLNAQKKSQKVTNGILFGHLNSHKVLPSLVYKNEIWIYDKDQLLAPEKLRLTYNSKGSLSAYWGKKLLDQKLGESRKKWMLRVFPRLANQRQKKSPLSAWLSWILPESFADSKNSEGTASDNDVSEVRETNILLRAAMIMDIKRAYVETIDPDSEGFKAALKDLRDTYSEDNTLSKWAMTLLETYTEGDIKSKEQSYIRLTDEVSGLLKEGLNAKCIEAKDKVYYGASVAYDFEGKDVQLSSPPANSKESSSVIIIGAEDSSPISKDSRMTRLGEHLKDIQLKELSAPEANLNLRTKFYLTMKKYFECVKSEIQTNLDPNSRKSRKYERFKDNNPCVDADAEKEGGAELQTANAPLSAKSIQGKQNNYFSCLATYSKSFRKDRRNLSEKFRENLHFIEEKNLTLVEIQENLNEEKSLSYSNIYNLFTGVKELQGEYPFPTSENPMQAGEVSIHSEIQNKCGKAENFSSVISEYENAIQKFEEKNNTILKNREKAIGLLSHIDLVTECCRTTYCNIKLKGLMAPPSELKTIPQAE